MTEEQKLDDKTKQELGDASIKRIEIIAHLIKEYFRALNDGKMNSFEFMAIGMDTVLAGYQLISRSNDMDMLDVDTRIATMKAVSSSIQQVLDRVYLNPEVVAGMVAQAAIESAKRDGVLKGKKSGK